VTGLTPHFPRFLSQWKTVLEDNTCHATTRVTVKCTGTVTEAELLTMLHDFWNCVCGLDFDHSTSGVPFSSFMITAPTIDNLKGNVWCGNSPQAPTGSHKYLLILSVYRKGRRTELANVA
jgi:hypothetical protein